MIKVGAVSLDGRAGEERFANGFACRSAFTATHGVEQDSSDMVDIVRGIEVVLVEESEGCLGVGD